jgi:hypothetical protein
LIGAGQSGWLAAGTLSHTFEGLSAGVTYGIIVEARHTSLDSDYDPTFNFPTETIPTFNAPSYLRARGEGSGTVGGAPVTITMRPAVEIATWDQFSEALYELELDTNRTEETFVLVGSFSIEIDDGVTIPSGTELTLIARAGTQTIGRGGVSLGQPLRGTMLQVLGTLNLGTIFTPANLIIDGSPAGPNYPAWEPSVVVSGVLNMYSGTRFTNNNITAPPADSLGGGVLVLGTGVFNMFDGNITNNTANDGGGVYVQRYGVFNMSGGTISGNYASRSGGGVFVEEEGVFTKTGGGIIHGSTQNSAWSGPGSDIDPTVPPAIIPPSGPGENAAGTWRPGVGSVHQFINGYGHAVFVGNANWDLVIIQDSNLGRWDNFSSVP